MKKALFYGDSNTYGYDPAGMFGGRYPRAQRWTTILGESLAGEWVIEENGLPGRSLPASKREWDILRGYLVSELPFDLFAVMLGTNDLLGTTHPSAERTTGRMNDLITLVDEVIRAYRRNTGAGGVRVSAAAEDDAVYGEQSTDSAVYTRAGGAQSAGAAGADVKSSERAEPQILLIAPPAIRLRDASFGEPYVTGDRSYAQIYYEEGRRLSAYYRGIAAVRGILFADAGAWDLDFAYDGVHLSEKGNAIFAQEMEKFFRAANL